MDKNKYTTEHRKGQHLTSEERHLIEVRCNTDHWTIYRIAKELGRPYNTVKDEIKRDTVLLYNGKVKRYKADGGHAVYPEHRQECRRKDHSAEAVNESLKELFTLKLQSAYQNIFKGAGCSRVFFSFWRSDGNNKNDSDASEQG